MAPSNTVLTLQSVTFWRNSVQYWAKSERRWASWTFIAEAERVKNMRSARTSRMQAMRSLRSEYRVLRSAVRAD